MSDTEDVFELDDRKAEIVPALHKNEGISTISTTLVLHTHAHAHTKRSWSQSFLMHAVEMSSVEFREVEKNVQCFSQMGKRIIWFSLILVAFILYKTVYVHRWICRLGFENAYNSIVVDRIVTITMRVECMRLWPNRVSTDWIVVLLCVCVTYYLICLDFRTKTRGLNSSMWQSMLPSLANSNTIWIVLANNSYLKPWQDFIEENRKKTANRMRSNIVYEQL